MQYVTAQFVFGSRRSMETPHVAYVVMGVDKYDYALSCKGRVHVRDEKTGMGAWFDTNECSAIHCGPKRDQP